MPQIPFSLELFDRLAYYTNKQYGPLAQLVEHPTLNRRVAGSIPVRPTNKKAKILKVRDLRFFILSFTFAMLLSQPQWLSHN